MRIRILGSAAGGGFPQWNCGCPGCRAVRDGSRPATPRTQSSIAISPDGRRWWLVNASPDVRTQLADTPALHPVSDRGTPLQGVLLTDAEIDHTLGLVLLREGGGVTLHATASTERTLRAGTGLLDTLERFCPVRWTPVDPGVPHDLGGLRYRAFDVPTGKHDRFGTGTGSGRVVGYRFTDTGSGRSAVYLPGVQELTGAVLDELDGADLLLVDGTTWHDDELVRLGLAAKTAHDMGHLHVGGPGGSLDVLTRPERRLGRVVYVHVNNTNPMLLEDSAERAEVTAAGLTVGTDGLELEV
ncbi:pyrroloquinoline quinone biosynthesis protein PqqB [Pseudonocardia sp. HH130630-07]|uniref:pyrroloquinoline quinone biosynthesis protein PqqB n=1 Tax=Pseudonocardia sp. HH130630-07 TaxID=1690815 RepID=UPI000814B651|nr:pyrroloquinoline quinone biosynthesis protein PqqB [Pseudonocardia sp. HH130630-07]ANY08762.1 pyrroloquinoline quinone biosynthesis protein B [Pseudonocardia sp. HH130630-07]